MLRRLAHFSPCVCLLAALALPTPAGATLPHTKNKRIVPAESIGGVRIGMSKSRVFALWGKPNPYVGCEHPYNKGEPQCIWTTKKGLQDNAWWLGEVEGVEVAFVHNRVLFVHLQAKGDSDPGGLSGWKTDSGIGLAATRQAVHRAYPRARSKVGQEGQWGYNIISRSGKHPGLTGFYYGRPHSSAHANRAWLITLEPLPKWM